MTRSQKLTFLKTLMQGETSALASLKEQTQRPVTVLTIDEYPEDWSDNETSLASVKVSYQLADGTPVTEYLTHSEINAKFTGVVALIPEYDRILEEETEQYFSNRANKA